MLHWPGCLGASRTTDKRGDRSLRISPVDATNTGLVAVLLQVAHEWRSAGAVDSRIRADLRLLLDVAAGVFQVRAAERFDTRDARVVRRAKLGLRGFEHELAPRWTGLQLRQERHVRPRHVDSHL